MTAAAADVSARVHLVAEKLQQKAQEAQRKGNDNAARALTASVSDLRQALALIAEQRHLLARRRAEGDDEMEGLNADDDVASSVDESVARLARVETMLKKKADDMTRKGNDAAATGLVQSAAAVEKGRLVLRELQQLVFGLHGRWEQLDGIVRQVQRCRRDGPCNEHDDRQGALAPAHLLQHVQQMVQLQLVVTTSGLIGDSRSVDDLQTAIEALQAAAQEAETLRRAVADARQEIEEGQTALQHKCDALKALERAMEQLKARHVSRRDEDAQLLEQQHDACRAMEQLVRESDAEIQSLKQRAAAQAEEVEALSVEMASVAAEKERLERVHRAEVDELQEQLMQAMDRVTGRDDEAERMETEEVQMLQRQLESLTLEHERLVQSHADEVDELRRQLEDATALVSAASDEVEKENENSKTEEVQMLQRQLESLTLEHERLVQSHADEVDELRRQLEDATALVSAESDEVEKENENSKTEEVQMLQRQLESLTLEHERLVQSHADEVDELRRQLEDATALVSAESDEVEKENENSKTEEVQMLQRQLESLTLEHERLVQSHADEVDELRRQLEDATALVSAESDEVEKENENSKTEEVQMLQRQLESLTLEHERLVQSHADEVDELRRQLEDATALVSAASDEVEKENENSKTEEVQMLQRQLESLTLEHERLVQSHADEVDELRRQLEDATALVSAESDEVEKENENSKTEEVQMLQRQLESLTLEHERLVQSHADEVDELRRQLEDATALVSAESDEVEKENENSKTEEVQMLQRQLESLTLEHERLVQSHADEVDELRRQLEDATALVSAESDEVEKENENSKTEEVQMLQRQLESLTLEHERLVQSHADEVDELRRQLEDATALVSAESDEVEKENENSKTEEVQMLQRQLESLTLEHERLVQSHADEVDELRRQLEDATALVSAESDEVEKENENSKTEEVQMLQRQLESLTLEHERLVQSHADEVDELRRQLEDATALVSAESDEVEKENENSKTEEVQMLQRQLESLTLEHERLVQSHADEVDELRRQLEDATALVSAESDEVEKENENSKTEEVQMLQRQLESLTLEHERLVQSHADEVDELRRQLEDATALVSAESDEVEKENENSKTEEVQMLQRQLESLTLEHERLVQSHADEVDELRRQLEDATALVSAESDEVEKENENSKTEEVQMLQRQLESLTLEHERLVQSHADEVDELRRQLEDATALVSAESDEVEKENENSKTEEVQMLQRQLESLTLEHERLVQSHADEVDELRRQLEDATALVSAESDEVEKENENSKTEEVQMLQRQLESLTLEHERLVQSHADEVDELRRQLEDATALVSAESDEVEKENENSKTEEVQMLQRQLESLTLEHERLVQSHADEVDELRRQLEDATALVSAESDEVEKEIENSKTEEVQMLQRQLESLTLEHERLVQSHADEVDELRRQLEDATALVSAESDEVEKENENSKTEEVQMLQRQLESLTLEHERLVQSHADEVDELRRQLEDATALVSAESDEVEKENENSKTEEVQMLQRQLESLTLEHERLVQSHADEVDELRRQLEDATALVSAESDEVEKENENSKTEEVQMLQRQLESLTLEHERLVQSHADEVDELRRQLEDATALVSAESDEVEKENENSKTEEVQMLQRQLESLTLEHERLVQSHADEVDELRRQLEDATALVSAESDEVEKENENSKTEEVQMLQRQLESLTLEHERLVQSHADEVDELRRQLEDATALVSAESDEVEKENENSKTEEVQMLQRQLESLTLEHERLVQSHADEVDELRRQLEDATALVSAESDEVEKENENSKTEEVQMLQRQLESLTLEHERLVQSHADEVDELRRQLEDATALVSAESDEVEKENENSKTEEVQMLQRQLESLTLEHERLVQSHADEVDELRRQLEDATALVSAESDEVEKENENSKTEEVQMLQRQLESLTLEHERLVQSHADEVDELRRQLEDATALVSAESDEVEKENENSKTEEVQMLQRQLESLTLEHERLVQSHADEVDELRRQLEDATALVSAESDEVEKENENSKTEEVQMLQRQLESLTLEHERLVQSHADEVDELRRQLEDATALVSAESDEVEKENENSKTEEVQMLQRQLESLTLEHERLVQSHADEVDELRRQLEDATALVSAESDEVEKENENSKTEEVQMLQRQLESLTLEHERLVQSHADEVDELRRQLEDATALVSAESDEVEKENENSKTEEVQMLQRQLESLTLEHERLVQSHADEVDELRRQLEDATALVSAESDEVEKENENSKTEEVQMLQRQLESLTLEHERLVQSHADEVDELRRQLEDATALVSAESDEVEKENENSKTEEVQMLQRQLESLTLEHERLVQSHADEVDELRRQLEDATALVSAESDEVEKENENSKTEEVQMLQRQLESLTLEHERLVQSHADEVDELRRQLEDATALVSAESDEVEKENENSKTEEVQMLQRQLESLTLEHERLVQSHADEVDELRRQLEDATALVSAESDEVEKENENSKTEEVQMLQRQLESLTLEHERLVQSHADEVDELRRQLEDATALVSAESDEVEKENENSKTEEVQMLQRQLESLTLEHERLVQSHADEVDELRRQLEDATALVSAESDEVEKENENSKTEEVQMLQRQLESLTLEHERLVQSHADEVDELRRQLEDATALVSAESDEVEKENENSKTEEVQMLQRQLESLTLEHERLVQSHADEVDELRRQLEDATALVSAESDEVEKENENSKTEEVQMLQRQLESLTLEHERLVQSHADEVDELRRQLEDATALVSAESDEVEKENENSKTEEVQMLQRQLESLTLEHERLVQSHADEVDELRRQLEDATALVSAASDEVEKENENSKTEEVQMLQRQLESLTLEHERLVQSHADEVDELRRQLEDATALVSAESDEVEKENENSKTEEVQMLQRQLESLTLEHERLVQSHADEVDELRRQLEDATALVSAESDEVEKENENSKTEEVQMLQRQLESLTLEHERLVQSHADEVDELRRQLEDATALVSAESDEVEKENENSKTEEVQMLQRQLESLTLEHERLVQSHADEVDELRRQLEDATALVSAESDEVEKENENSKTEEVQMLQRQLESLTLEHERLVQSHADEVDELRRQLEDATALVSAESDEVEKENENSKTEEVQMLQRQLESLTLEHERLVQSHADEVDELRRQLEDATALVSAESDEVEKENENSKTEEVQMLQRQLESLTLEHERLVQSHADEVDDLRRQFDNKLISMIEELSGETEADEKKYADAMGGAGEEGSIRSRCEEYVDGQSDCIDTVGESCHQRQVAINDIRANVDSVSDELHLLQVKTEGLISDNEGRMKSCVAEVAVLQTAHRDEIEGLHRHLDRATASLLALVETLDSSSMEELQKLKDEVRVITTKKDKLAEMYDDEIRMLKATYTAEIDDLRYQLNSTAAGNLARGQRNDQTHAAKELQREDEVERISLQADLDVLQSRVDDYEVRCQAQQGTISTLEEEQAELESRLGILAVEKSRLADELERSREETARLTQRLDDSEDINKCLATQLKDAKLTLEEKLAEQDETIEALEHCKEELRACRAMLGAQIRECSLLKSELEVVRDAQDVRSGHAEECLSTLTTELHQMVHVLKSGSELGDDILRELMERVWQSPEVTELCDGLVPLLTDLASTQDQIRSIKERLQLARSDCDSQKLIIEQFMKTSNWQLFAKDDETMEEVKEGLDSDGDLCERLAIARTNVSQWLAELQLLRTHVEEDTLKLNALADEKLQEQKRVVALTESEHDLRVLVESLKEELGTMQTVKSQDHLTSMQEQEKQAALQEEVEKLEQKLTTMRADYERYRVRSHAALKKMEKRAELLNSMRKENEALLTRVRESEEQQEQAVVARNDMERRLQEEQRTQAMIQADFDLFAAEKSRVIADLEKEGERLALEKEQMSTKVLELTVQMQTLEAAKKQMEEENERMKQAEQAAFQTRLDTATAAVQSAKKELEKMRSALEVSEAENGKRQQLIEFLELKLKDRFDTKVSASTTTVSRTESVVPTSVEFVSSLASSSEGNSSAAVLEQEVRTLKATEIALKKHLGDARAELAVLQERFATTKAANAEKVFALEEQSNQYKMELAAVTEEVKRLTAVVAQAQKREVASHVPIDGTPTPLVDSSKQDEMMAVQTQEVSDEIPALTAALADANREIKLLTVALADSQEELQEAQNVLHLFAPSPIESENNDDASASAKAAKVLTAKEEALKKMRKQVFTLQEEMETLQEEKAALELRLDTHELTTLQAQRNQMQLEKEHTMQVQKRQAEVVGFEKQVAAIVDDLQQRLEDHSRAFRDVYDFSDTYQAVLYPSRAGNESNDTRGLVNQGSGPEFEECLVMRSGVVIKAGATFELPVICEKSGSRVVWSFSVKEETADVVFKLCALVTKDTVSSEVEVVSPERTNEQSGVFHVQHDNTTLVYKWDNSFAWLQEKTLDYHVSIQEQLSPKAQTIRRTERELQARAKVLANGVALLETEAQCRADLESTLERLDACEAKKELSLAAFARRKEEVLTRKAQLDRERETHKALYSAIVKEQDELETVERSIVRAWQAAEAEREDVEMTLQLTGNGVQLKELAHEIKEQAEAVTKELEQSVHEGEDTLEESNESDEQIGRVRDAENDVHVVEPEDGSSSAHVGGIQEHAQ
ncbi:unnamed protein product [Hyaloperonospora brassicae]|uniref:GOLD domain-containing protein n=1 Tax=Hyaloperonospora brassicae TaxID=162125 RepID=A0AAV0TGV6_HYABA|nr:unnamed protein product [Hyaloperonospora brassicae]